MTVYLLPGVGCDKRLFSRIELPGHEVKVLEWPPFPKGCALEELAEAMRHGVDATRPHVLAGVSMGGMVAQELALMTKPEKIVLISTWTGPKEWPWHVHVAKFLGLSWMIGSFTMHAMWPLKRILGRRPRDIDRLLWDMARAQTAGKVRRGVQAVLRWEGCRREGRSVRIHGDADRVTPLRFPVDHIVHGGAHIMILTRAAEISRLLQEECRIGP